MMTSLTKCFKKVQKIYLKILVAFTNHDFFGVIQTEGVRQMLTKLTRQEEG